MLALALGARVFRSYALPLADIMEAADAVAADLVDGRRLLEIAHEAGSGQQVAVGGQQIAGVAPVGTVGQELGIGQQRDEVASATPTGSPACNSAAARPRYCDSTASATRP